MPLVSRGNGVFASVSGRTPSHPYASPAPIATDPDEGYSHVHAAAALGTVSASSAAGIGAGEPQPVKPIAWCALLRTGPHRPRRRNQAIDSSVAGMRAGESQTSAVEGSARLYPSG